MSKIVAFVLMFIVLAIPTYAGTLAGAWEMQADKNSNERAVMIATQNYLSIAVFEKNLFVRTYGGSYQIKDEKLTLTLEYDTKDSSNVGTATVFNYSRTGDKFTLSNLATTNWVRIDEHGHSKLSGLWRFFARVNPDGTTTESKRGPRKTLKICSDGRFQWMAINIETKQFFGTGGGTYKLEDGKYTETLEFSSRDNKRVGTSLTFDAIIENDKWKHSGKSSKGDPISEIWGKEN